MNEKIYIKNLLTIKEYKSTLNSFLDEEKIDRPKKKSRYFVDLIQAAIQSNDFNLLLKIWEDYEILYFKFLDFDKQRAADTMKSDIYKAFLVECFKNKRNDKINIFFQTMGTYILNNKVDWVNWLEFPLVKFPSEHKVFAIYFTRSWLDNFFSSMFNFFMQVVRSVMSSESELERFFSLDMRLDNFINQLETNELEFIQQKYNLPDNVINKNEMANLIISSIQYTPKHLHDITELLCDFRLTRENLQFEHSKLSRGSKPKGISHLIQNKPKSTSPNTFLKKKTVSNGNAPVVSDINNLTSDMSVNLLQYVSPETSKNLSNESFGSIKQLSNKISQKIFKPKLNNENSKPLIYHEHFSMVTYVKFSRIPAPFWASLDVGGTFKIWSTNEASKSLHTLSFKHTIYSFDWVSCTTNLLLLGTKGGSIKLFNITNNEIIREMVIDTTYPRINIVQSFDNDDKFVCESLDRSRATILNTALPQGIISLYDIENWSSIRTNLMNLNSEFTVNCICCSTDTIIAGSSNGCVHLMDVRIPHDAVFCSLPVFVGDEVVNVTGMCQSKWIKSSLDSNYLMCLSSKSHFKMFDIRQTMKSLPKESCCLPDLNIPLSWTGRPSGGEQTIYFPRANLISPAFINNSMLFSASKNGVLMQKIVGPSLTEPSLLNVGHNSPVICLDSSPSDSNDPNNAVVVSGTMEGTISMMKINTNK